MLSVCGSVLCSVLSAAGRRVSSRVVALVRTVVLLDLQLIICISTHLVLINSTALLIADIAYSMLDV